MASVTATRRALTDTERSILCAFGVEDRIPADVPDRLEPAILAWFEALVGDDAAAGASLPQARVAWLLVDGPGRWADRFLAPDAPPALVSALREAWPCLTPCEKPMAMPDQPLHGESTFAGLARRGARLSHRRDRTVPAR